MGEVARIEIDCSCFQVHLGHANCGKSMFKNFATVATCTTVRFPFKQYMYNRGDQGYTSKKKIAQPTKLLSDKRYHFMIYLKLLVAVFT